MVSFKYVIALIVAVVLVAGYILFVPSSIQARQGVIELTNLPDQYCPVLATVVVAKSSTNNSEALTDSNVAIDQCRYITLNKLTALEGGSRLLFVKLPSALAFRIQIDSIKGHYQYAPSLGDVNGDNVIDATDESQVANSLFSIDLTAVVANDIDQDRKVSVLDLSLTRINHRAGVSRPDGKSWSKT